MKGIVLIKAFIFCYCCLILGSGCDDASRSGPAPGDHGAVSSGPVGNIVKGKELYITCRACHGDQGQGIKEVSGPAIAGQESWYIVQQLDNYRNNIRGTDTAYLPGLQMATTAKTLDDDQALADVAAYINSLEPVKPIRTLEGVPAKGKQQYAMICGACHGPNAEGNEKLHSPRLTILDDWYLKVQYDRFVEGKRGKHPDDTYGAQMQDISGMLSDEEAILDVIVYIQSLQK